jgi:uncharacterized membrane protein HdeD (DUF308 family)
VSQSAESPTWRSEPPPGALRPIAGPETSHRRGPLIVSGFLAIVGGAVALIVPAIASVGTALFIGWVLVFASLAIGIHAFAVGGLGRALLRLLFAVITLAAGLYLLISPLEGTFTLTVMLVMWFVALGIARLVAGLAELGIPGAGYTILSGVVSLVLGALIASELPSSADWAIGLLVGIDLLVAGASALGLAWAISDEGRLTAR